jgi:hypothetical protein
MINKNNLIKNKKGWTGLDFLIGLIVFGGSIGLFVLMVGSLANDYDNSEIIDEEFSDNFDKFSETTEIAEDIYETMNKQNGTGLTLVGTADLFFTGGFGVINLLFSSITTATTILFTFPTYFGMDTTASVIMMTMIFSILTISIVFIVINSLRGNKL